MFDADVVMQTFWSDLVFVLDGDGTGCLEQCGGSGGVYCIAKANAAVDDEGKVGSGGDPACNVGDLGVRKQRLANGVLKAECAATEVTGGESSIVCKPCRQRVKTQRRKDGSRPIKRCLLSSDLNHHLRRHLVRHLNRY